MEATSTVDAAAWRQMVNGAWAIDIPVPAKTVAIALRAAKAEGPETYAMVLGMALERRRSRLLDDTLLQRKWQTKVSRRPQRGRHHDSWAIREKYVRCMKG